MKTRPLSHLIATCVACACLASSMAAAEMPSHEEMWRIIQMQQQQIKTLTERLNASEAKAQSTSQKVEATDAKIEATSVYLEEIKQVRPTAADGWFQRTQIGGYGELHYNIARNDRIDFHRWVMYLAHDFSDRIRFFSELELEHSFAADGKPGEVELEQAFLEFNLSEMSTARAGLFLVPAGILNETHEPTTFYGVERNLVENRIIPTTWWEAGVGFAHRTPAGFAFDAAAHSGLKVPTSGGSAFAIRSGRQKAAEAEASDGAVTGRLKYTGIPGLEVAVTGQYQQDLAQGALSETIDATLFETHVDWKRGPFGLRALYARWDLGGNAPAAIGADEQYGYYIEPSYRFATNKGDVGLFARYSAYDLKAGGSADTKDSFLDVGLNFWPHPNVVLKGDVQFTDFADSSKDETIVNLGVGYRF